MKILHVVASLDEKYGGPSILLPKLTIKQFESKNEIDIVTTHCSNEDLKFKKKFLNQGINLFIFKVFSKYRISLNLIFWLVRNLRNYNVIHIHGIYRFPVDITFIFCFLCRLNFVFSAHGSLDPYLFKRSDNKLIGLFSKRIIHLILHFPLKNVLFHFTASEEKKLCMLNHLVKKSFIIPPIAIDYSNSNNLNKSYVKDMLKIERDTFLIGYIGRLHEKKNIDSLIKEFNSLSAKIQEKLALIILGPGSNKYKNYLKNLIGDIKNKNIYLYDQVPHEQVDKYMHGLDLYALPSHSDNFGITIIEALSKGVPVLISDKVNIYKKIEDYNCGKVIQNTPKAIESGLYELIRNKNKLKIMQENAINLIKSEYSWNKILPKYTEMYEKSMKI